MLEIREDIYDRLEQDTAIQGYTGYTASDSRIYLESPPEKVRLNTTTPAYITYILTKPSAIDLSIYVEKAQELDIIVEVDVWANGPDVRDNIGERITHIFKDREWNTTSYRALKTDKEAEEDIKEIHPTTGQIDIWRKYLRFKLWHVYKK